MEIMRARAGGIIRQGSGPRIIVKKGVTTADAEHPIVTEHPHLWEPVKVDFPAGTREQRFVAAADESGLPHVQALRDLLTGLYERGLMDDVDEGMPAGRLPGALVAVALRAIDEGGWHDDTTLDTVRAALSRSIMGLTDDSATGIISELQNAGILFRSRISAGDGDPARTVEQDIEPARDDPHPVAGDLRRTGGGQLQEWGDGMWHDGDDPPAAAPDSDPVVDPHRADPGTREGRAEIRQWARDHDIEVAATGPLSPDLVERYMAAHGG